MVVIVPLSRKRTLTPHTIIRTQWSKVLPHQLVDAKMSLTIFNKFLTLLIVGTFNFAAHKQHITMTRNFLKISRIAAVMIFTVSCKENANEVEAMDAETEAMASDAAVTYNVDTAASTIAWIGSKPTADHTGTIALQSGMVQVNGEDC